MKKLVLETDGNVLVKQATRQGFIELITYPGVADLSYPTSKVRRGRVQEGGDKPYVNNDWWFICV